MISNPILKQIPIVGFAGTGYFIKSAAAAAKFGYNNGVFPPVTRIRSRGVIQSSQAIPAGFFFGNVERMDILLNRDGIIRNQVKINHV